MDWGDRLTWLAIGCAIGYIIRMLQEIKKEVHEVDTIVKNERDEAGFARVPLILDVLIVCLFVMTGYSVFRVEDSVDKANQAVQGIEAQQASDKAQNDRIETIVRCTLAFTSQTIRALNERTQYTQKRANANVRVLAEQARFLEVVLLIPPATDAARRLALEAYFERLREFNEVAKLSKNQVIENPYPTNEQLYTCLRVEREKKENQE